MGNSDDVASAGAGHSPSRSFDDAQLTAFWAAIVANLDGARRIASKFVKRHSVDDVVHSAALLFIEGLQPPNKPPRLPPTGDAFRGEFLKIVRNHAIDCVRDSHVAERPVHSHWADASEPVVEGRKTADRELDRVFARNDHGEYDAPAPTERHPKEDLDELLGILRCHLEDLSPRQRTIIEETYFEQRKRAEVSAHNGISVSTYDNHLQAAFRALRESMEGVVDISSDMDRPPWYDRIEDLIERRAARQRLRPSDQKRKRCTSRCERSTSEGERSNSEGERSNVAHGPGNNSRAGAA